MHSHNSTHIQSPHSQLPTPNCSQSGFTIVEMLITIIIIAILVAILSPVYRNYLYKSNRGDAVQSLLHTQILQEKYRVNNTSYSTSFTDISGSTNSINGFYTLGISAAGTASYTLTAAPTGTQSSDTACTNFTITYANGTTTLSSAPQTDCWSQ